MDAQVRVVTQYGAGAVPDWGIRQAVREFVQNALDESAATGTRPSMTVEYGMLTVADAGRGCDLDGLLVYGESSKRGDATAVGYHGEGATMAIVAAARAGYAVEIRSQDWTARFHLIDTGNRYQRLAYDRCTAAPVTGTTVTVAGDHDALVESLTAVTDQYRHHAALGGTLGVLHAESAGSLWSRGQYVCTDGRLALAYNLDAHPGRDRDKFDLYAPAVADCLVNALGAATAEDIVTVFRHRGAFELSLPVADIDDTIARAVKLARAVLDDSDSAHTTDAERQGYLVVYPWFGCASVWRRLIPYAGTVCTTKLVEPRPVAKLVAECCTAVATLTGLPNVSYLIQDAELDNGARAAGSHNSVIFSLSWLRYATDREFMSTFLHELGHAVDGASDCTRRHMDHVTTLAATLALAITTDSNATVLRQSLRKLARWQKTLER